MASLFANLPAPKGAKARQPVDLSTEYQPAGPDRALHVAQEQTEHHEARPEKRPRLSPSPSPEPEEDDDEAPSHGHGAATEAEAAPAAAVLPGDQVSAALKKISSHISNPEKFAKASSLFRTLFEQNSISKLHRDDAWEVVRAAFSDFDNTSEPSMRRDYMKLCHILDKNKELFSRAQRVQLEVYRIVGFVQNELHTDDSFVLNKVLARVKEMVDALPEATEEDELAMEQVRDPEAAAQAAAEEAAKRQAKEQAAAEARRAAEQQRQQEAAVELDPFGLDSLLEAPAPAKKLPPPDEPAQAGPLVPPTVWSPAQALVMRRQALIECIISAKMLHKLQWAKTSVELLVEHYNKHRDRFTGEQQLVIDELLRFVKAARQARAAGPSQREINRDTTSYERARKEWSKATVSHRGKVGAQGDTKTQNWLG